jgi:hypothetical protein
MIELQFELRTNKMLLRRGDCSAEPRATQLPKRVTLSFQFDSDRLERESQFLRQSVNAIPCYTYFSHYVFWRMRRGMK